MEENSLLRLNERVKRKGRVIENICDRIDTQEAFSKTFEEIFH